ncbi:MAG: hypothetical protein FJ395_00150 [Verrucomicrobia bacterium]|nr:hypothetical protein [Verrucomicrobiota bacterium]
MRRIMRLARIRQLARLAGGLRRFLRTPVTHDQAVADIRRRMENRNGIFIALAKKLIYDLPVSPYRKLLLRAGCEHNDLADSVKACGIEKTLEKLRDAGVCVSLDEFKAREGDFDNPYLGGHLSAMVGVTQPRDGLEPKDPYGDVPSSVSCVVDMYGPLYMKVGELPAGELPVTAVLRYLDKNDPPFLILHGTADKTVDVARSRELAAALTKAGVAHELVIIEGAPHTFHLQPKQRDLRPLVLGFFDKHLNKAGK